ncbi:MAG: fumarylacetoacetate hydrolase [Bryobacterales bacterium]|nr:fumarylacetoacetate hydrolase [Bryobacterales bacterium]
MSETTPARETAFDMLISMRLMTFRYGGQDHAGVVTPDGVVPVLEINTKHDLHTPNSLLEIIKLDIRELPTKGVAPIPLTDVEPRLPYAVPPKIWCIGLNYKSHAEDIAAVQPEEPGSFMKPASCMFQPGGNILLPPTDVSDDVDAEGELGLIIGRSCRFVPVEKAREVIYGFTTTLDLTALDVLRKNPRYLTRAKSIDTFFSFGPVIVTADEVGDIDDLEVITEHNDGICSRDFVRNMKHRPLNLVAFHSNFFTLHPGDVISTGCPKGARIKHGDTVQARIEGIGTIKATVTQGDRVPFGFTQ